MSHLLYYVPALACPVGMGAMMWLMMRGKSSNTAPDAPAQLVLPTSDQRAELARLRAELDEMRSQARNDRTALSR